MIAAAEFRLRELERERDATLARIAALRAQGDESSPELSPTEKMRMFGELFQGRRDVFPRRWENGRTGRSGYAPACRNEWAAGVCGKPTVRCGVCPNQAFESFDGAVLLGHLRGRQIVGVYPLLEDDTCWFCAIDLDGTGWRDDTRASGRLRTNSAYPSRSNARAQATGLTFGSSSPSESRPPTPDALHPPS